VDERVGKGLSPQNSGVKSKQFEDKPLEKQTNNNSEFDIFPTLKKYKDEHSTANLQKLMVEILEFCRSVYASTRNEDERKIYHNFIEKLNK
jgi:regulator of replication initiation timing